MASSIYRWCALWLFVPLAFSCTNTTGSAGSYKLAVVITVDQMRADHLTRFAGVYKHGFARLIKQGVHFSRAYQDHASTSTGPGHASIGTGVHPAKHGIVDNSWIERATGRSVYCSEDTTVTIFGREGADGRSPAQLRADGLGDWLKRASSASKVVGVGRKDRSGIMMAGKAADAVYWYNSRNGEMTSSTYYFDALPAYVDDFNKSGVVDSYFAEGWQKVAPDSVYGLAREDAFATEGDGENTTFPHLFTARSSEPDRRYYSALTATPFTDHLVLEFARTLIENERLGIDESPDVLFIGCSSADGVGHAYGPFSQESMDQFLRLDVWLGAFFDWLDEHIGAENYLLVLTSDHGAMPMPEELQRRGVAARRIDSGAFREKFPQIDREVAVQIGVPQRLSGRGTSVGLNLEYEAAASKWVSPHTLDSLFAAKLAALEPIERVFTRPERESWADAGSDTLLTLYRRSYFAPRSADLALCVKEFYRISGPRGTGHGTPWSYDRHVPIIAMGNGIDAGEERRHVRTVDIAPTVARLLGVAPPATVDGVDLLRGGTQ